MINLIKVANKSAAHLTTSTSTQEELESIQPATRIIHKLMIDYVDGINKEKLWINVLPPTWHNQNTGGSVERKNY